VASRRALGWVGVSGTSTVPALFAKSVVRCISARSDERLLTPRVVGEVVDGHDPIRIHGGVRQEVFVEVVTEQVCAVLANADELNNELERSMEWRRIRGVELVGLGR